MCKQFETFDERGREECLGFEWNSPAFEAPLCGKRMEHGMKKNRLTCLAESGSDRNVLWRKRTCTSW